jgi:hypothetical protein
MECYSTFTELLPARHSGQFRSHYTTISQEFYGIFQARTAKSSGTFFISPSTNVPAGTLKQALVQSDLIELYDAEIDAILNRLVPFGRLHVDVVHLTRGLM